MELDTSLGDRGFFIDEGKTGFVATGERRRRLEDGYARGELIRHCETGRIPAGSFMVCESADRISRESPVVAINLFTRLLMLGVTVVTLTPESEYRTDADIGKLILVGVSTDRAHGESRVKSVRLRAMWEAKRREGAGQPITHTVSAWCKLVGAKKVKGRLVGGEIREDRGKADTVRRMFALARAGMGARTIAARMTAEGVPVVGQARSWNQSIVYHILTNPAVIGEYHPHTGRTGSKRKGRAETRKPTGVVVAG